MNRVEGMKMPQSPTQRRTGDAWKRARVHGCDMKLLEENIRRAPAERIVLHRRARALAEAILLARKTTRE